MTGFLEWMQSFDTAAMLAINSLVGRWEIVDSAIQQLETWKLLLYGWLAAFVWWAWFDRTDVEARTRLLASLAGVALATVSSVLLQHLLSIHPRPFTQPFGLSLTLVGPPRTDMYQRNSFPSDTLTLSFAMATAIFLHSRKAGLVAFAWAATAITTPRLYLAYHWPSDIVAAFVLGVSVVVLVSRLGPIRKIGLFLVMFERHGRRFFYPLAFVFTQQVAELFHGSHMTLRLATRIGRLLD